MTKTAATAIAQKIGPLPQRDIGFVRNRCHAINQSHQFRVGLGLGHQADHHGHDDANNPRPERAVHVLGHVVRIRRKRDVAQRRRIDLHPGPHSDRRHCPGQQTPESALRRRPLPQHAQHHRSEQRRDKEAEQSLHIVHDAEERHHQVRRAHRDQHTDDGGPASHLDVVFVAGVFVDQRAVDVVGPDRGERADVARHARHESSDQRRDAQSQKSRARVARQHQRQHFVVAVAS